MRRKGLVITLVTLLVLVLVVDRVALMVATRMADSRIEKELDSSIDTKVSGFPFLLAAAKRTLPTVKLSGEKVNLGAVGLELQTMNMTLHDVKVGSGNQVRAHEMDATALVTYSQVEWHTKINQNSLSGTSDGLVGISRGAAIPGTSQRVTMFAKPVVNGNKVTVEPERFEYNNAVIELSPAARDVIVEKSTFTMSLKDLPEGMTLREIKATPDGLELHLTGADVLLNKL